jgi:hypothetical protein
LKTNRFKFSIPVRTASFGGLFYQEQYFYRKSHALSTKYNILYNGQIGLTKELKSGDQDDFWHRLPIECGNQRRSWNKT